MKLSEILRPESVLVPLEGATKEEIIRRLVKALPLEDDPEATDRILRAVMERERVMSTGIGRGVAIPHAKCDGISGLMASVGIAKEPLPFEAIDGKPVKIFFLIVSDPRTTSPHIKALSQISRILNDRTHKQALLDAESVEDVLRALELDA